MMTETGIAGLDGALGQLGRQAGKAEREARALLRTMTELQKVSRGTARAGAPGGGLGGQLAATLAAARRDMSGLKQMGAEIAGGLDRAFAKAFERFIVSGRDARAVLKGLEADLLRMGTRAAFRSLGNGGGNGQAGALGSLFSGMFSGQSGAASLLRLIPGFASGGEFTVGGAAGADRNLVPLRLTRGERVTVETPAQARRRDQAGSMTPALHMTFNITTPDAASFRLSQTQIQGEALRQAQRALKRNG